LSDEQSARRRLLRPGRSRAPFPTDRLSLASLALLVFIVLPAVAHAQGGVPLWTNRYNFGPNASSDATAIAVDGNGNVFVTGGSYNADTNSDYATIKYSNAGVPLWTNRYDGPGNGYDRAYAIAVDSDGNAVVTGASSGIGTSLSDYATIKYSSVGVALWTNRYDGVGNGGGDAWAIAVDSAGNVFVSGASRGTFVNDFDYATVAYSSAGVPLWTNRYDGPENGWDQAAGIAVDSSGNVFVTGGSGLVLGAGARGYDFDTLAYSSAGDLLWENRYDGPLSSGDYAYGIAVDGNGNVFVTGVSYNPGTTINDYATVGYSNAGIPLWTRRYNGPGNPPDDGATAIAVDGSGNVCVTGYSLDANGLSGFATIKYSSAGVPSWTRRYSAGNANATSPQIAVDSSGDVFVTGESGNGSATIAYSNSGAPLWTNRFRGSLRKVAVDSSGNVFVAGSSYNGINSDFVTIKYSSSVPPPRLDFQTLNNQLVLSWTNAGFNLQTAPAVTGPFTNLPAATSPYTNPLTAPQQFFRLISN
jgi:hypothetical protein